MKDFKNYAPISFPISGRHCLVALFLIVVLSLHARVWTGVEMLRAGGFAELQGKKVGLVTNPTGVDSELISTIDILAEARGVTLAALFAPEHGVRGDIAAGGKVANTVDPATGVKVYSLHGATRKPTAAMLRGLDVMVYDIQDIGCRSYTFISTLGKVMEACVEHGLPLMVLDRPNPLGGVRVEGPMTVDAACRSFVSQYSMPYIYGLTIGEFARWLNATQFEGKCQLTVVKMQGWKRDMTFSDTHLPWVPTSPNVPTAETAFFYPALGILGELGTCQIGANYTMPFRVAVGSNFDAEKLCKELRSYDLAGVMFRPCHLTISGTKLHGVEVYLVEVYLSDNEQTNAVAVQFYIMQALKAQGIDVLAGAAADRLSMFDNVCGSKTVRQTFVKHHKAADVLPLLTEGADKWRKETKPYLLY